MPHIPPRIPGTAITDLEAKNKIWSTINGINIALMVTQDSFGHFHARPMATQRPDKEDQGFTGEIWFLTHANSTKVGNIRDNPDVLLSYAEPKTQSYISIAGTAEIIRDTEKVHEFWHEPFRQWFPEGPNDPDIALIRVQAETAEYWDGPSKSIVYAYGYFKQRPPGKIPESGDRRRTNLDTARSF